jgi:hypothetical protein
MVMKNIIVQFFVFFLVFVTVVCSEKSDSFSNTLLHGDDRFTSLLRIAIHSDNHIQKGYMRFLNNKSGVSI